MKQLINDIMSGKVEMSFDFKEVQDSCTELAKRTFMEVYVDTEKYPEYKKDTQKIQVFGIGLWIFRCDTKKSFLKIAEENKVTKVIPGSITMEFGTPFNLDELDHLGINDPVGIVEVALSSGMRNEFIYPDLLMKFRVNELLSTELIHKILISSFSRKYFMSKAKGAQKTMPKINQETVVNAMIPLPPLAEQKEIVTKVESLLAKVTELENQIQERKKISVQLMQSVLKNTFAPQE